MKTLIIAEKPSVAKDISRLMGCEKRKQGYIEGDKYIVTWAVGHLIGLKYPEEHDPKYKKWELEDLPLTFDLADSLKVLPTTKEQFEVIKSLIAREDIDMIINAGDAGREGYLIQAWIYHMAGNKKPVKVLWASSITDGALKKAMENLKEDRLFHGLLQEAEARAEGDFFMGINYSRALSLKYGRSLSYGRCQTPLLNLIVQRDREIENFRAAPYYQVEITYSKGFKGVLIENREKREAAKLPDKKLADQVINVCKEACALVDEIEEGAKSKTPPLLYDLATLQKTMDARYGYSPEKTLEIAQKLYEERKILSYPRTDSRYLSSDLLPEIEEHISCCDFGRFTEIIKNIEPDRQVNPVHLKKYVNDLKVTDHYALIPTSNSKMEEIYDLLSMEEKNVFDAIILSFLAIFYPAYVYIVTDIFVNCHNFLFHSQGTTIVQLGYKKILNMEPGEENAENEKLQLIPELLQGDVLTIDKLKRLDKATRPPAGYTASTLIGAMEKYNIGTSATRAEIIKNLQNPQREYIKLEGRKYKSTELGRSFIDIMPDQLRSPELTSQFEEKLKLINEGKILKKDFLKALEMEFRENLRSLDGSVTGGNEDSLKCPACGRKIYAGKRNYYCSGYKEGCSFSISKEILGKSISEIQVKKLLQYGRSDVIKGFVGKKGNFDAALSLCDGKLNFLFTTENKNNRHHS